MVMILLFLVEGESTIFSEWVDFGTCAKRPLLFLGRSSVVHTHTLQVCLLVLPMTLLDIIADTILDPLFVSRQVLQILLEKFVMARLVLFCHVDRGAKFQRLSLLTLSIVLIDDGQAIDKTFAEMEFWNCCFFYW